MPDKNGHVILYRTGGDSRVDRANIALLKRIVQKSTTLVFLEIYYHAPLKLGAWSEPQERVRYVRLRSAERLPVAERITNSAGISILVLNDSILLSAADVWQLLGHSTRESLVALTTRRTLKNQQEFFLHLFLRDACLRLRNWLYPQGYFVPENFAVNPSLFGVQRGISLKSFHEKMAFAAFTDDLGARPPLVLSGRSFAVRDSHKIKLLQAALETALAITVWKKTRKFPWWFSSRHFLFHVAQTSAYLAALAAMVSVSAGLILVAFAIIITPQFSLTGYRLRRPWLWPVQLASRVAVYFFG